MQALLHLEEPQLPQAIPYNQFDVDDQQGEDLFNQIQLNQQPASIKQQLDSTQKIGNKSKNVLQLDSEEQNNNSAMKTPKYKMRKQKKNRSDKKKKKQQKKLAKNLKKLNKKSQNAFKRLRKQGQDIGKQQSGKWSGQSSDSSPQDSDVSSDSLLGQLNPSKKKTSKARKTQRKQGFSLKQLGNQGQVDYEDKNQDLSDESFKGNKNKKTLKAKAQKKAVASNQDILKSFLQIGLCVQQQNQGNKNKEIDDYDNGLEQMDKIKGGKKKGPKIANKLFADLEINEQEEANKIVHKELELEIKPRVNNRSSQISLSFLAKAQKIKKVRGMQSEMLNQQYQKLISIKAKQSMIKLIRQKQLQDAEDIELDVKVPEVIKGNEKINNSIFLKKISSTASHHNRQPNESKQPTPAPKQIKNQHKTKITRAQFFKSISEDVKARKSKEYSGELIKNNFKITNLDQIEQMRKRNEEKKKRQILGNIQDEEDDNVENEANQVHENKLGFMNFRVEIQDAKPNKQEMINEQAEKQVEQKKEGDGTDKKEQEYETKQFKIQLNDALPDKAYRKLLQFEQGIEAEEDQQSEQIQDDVQQQDDAGKQDQQQIGIEESMIDQNQEQQNIAQQSEALGKQIDQAQPVDLEVDLEVSNLNNEQEEQFENDSGAEQKLESGNEKEEHVNEEYQIYLNQLEAEGIKIKKAQKSNNHEAGSKKIDIKEYLIESKENIQSRENNGQLIQNNQDSQARKQFRKLRKLAIIVKNKKMNQMRIQRAGQFYDEQAEEGSDDENHDNLIKRIDYDEEAKQFQGIDLDADLVQLIDDVDINEEQDIAFQKFMEDEKIKDREQLKRIMNGDFRRRTDAEPLIEQIDEDEKMRLERMNQFQEYLRQKEMEQGKDLYMKESQNKEDNSEQQSENSKVNGNKQIKGEMQEEEMVDEINEENLKRYFDEGAAEGFKSKLVKFVPMTDLPESYRRQKKTEFRNTIKAKERIGEMKLKKTSSHLNEMIMKNKQKIKPLVLLKSLAFPNRKK